MLGAATGPLAATAAAGPSPRPTLYLTGVSGVGAGLVTTTTLGQPDDVDDVRVVGDWDGNGTDTVGLYRPRTRQLVLNKLNDAASSSTTTIVGDPGDVPIVGRWNAGLATAKRDVVALYRPNNRTLYYPSSATSGLDTAVQIGGNPGDVPVAGDWNADGIDTLGLWRPGTVNGGSLYTKNSNTVVDYTLVASGMGNPGDKPVIGDWNNDNKDTLALFRPGTYSGNTFYGANAATDYVQAIPYGNPGDVPTVGDWNGDGSDSVGVFRPDNHTFYLSTSTTAPNASLSFALTALRAEATDKLLYADWDGDGTDSPAVYRPSTRVVTYGNSSWMPTSNTMGAVGDPGDIPLAGRWNSSVNRDVIGLFRPSNNTFYWSNQASGVINTSSAVNSTPGDIIVTGDWNNDGVDTLGIWRPSNNTFFIRNTNDNVPWSVVAQGIGNPGDLPYVGHFVAGGPDRLGIYRPSTTMAGTFFGNNPSGDLAGGTTFGNAGDLPAVGDWDGNGVDSLGVSRINPPNYGGANSIVDTSAEADVFIEDFRNAASDSAASALYSELAATDRSYVDTRLRQVAGDLSLQRDVVSGAVWYIAAGSRYWVSSASAAQDAGLNLSSAHRTTAGGVAPFPRGADVVPKSVSAQEAAQFVVGPTEQPTAADTAELGDGADADLAQQYSTGGRGCKEITVKRDLSTLLVKYGHTGHMVRFCWNSRRKVAGSGGKNNLTLSTNAAGTYADLTMAVPSYSKAKAYWGGAAQGQIRLTATVQMTWTYLKDVPFLESDQTFPITRVFSGHWDGTWHDAS